MTAAELKPFDDFIITGDIPGELTKYLKHHEVYTTIEHIGCKLVLIEGKDRGVLPNWVEVELIKEG